MWFRGGESLNRPQSLVHMVAPLIPRLWRGGLIKSGGDNLQRRKSEGGGSRKKEG